MQFIIVVFLAVILYLLQLWFYRHYWNKNLSVHIKYSQPEAEIGDEVQLIETIENRKWLPLPILYVKFSSSKTFAYEDINNAVLSDHYYRNDVFSISGNQRVIRKQHFKTTARGYYVISSVDLVGTDLFLRRSYACMYENHAALYVYPKQIRTKKLLQLTSAITGHIKQTNLYEDPFLFRSIREYTATDSMKHINWKATAKTGQIMVNTHYDSQQGEVVLLLNLDSHVTQRSYQLTESCICVAATMLYEFYQAGLYYRLAVNGKEPVTGKTYISKSGSGKEHYKNLLHILCRLNLQKEPTDFLEFFEGEKNQFSQKDSHTTYVILSNYRKPLLLEAYEKKQIAGYHMYFLCPERKEHMTAAPFVNYLEVEPDAL